MAVAHLMFGTPSVVGIVVFAWISEVGAYVPLDVISAVARKKLTATCKAFYRHARRYAVDWSDPESNV